MNAKFDKHWGTWFPKDGRVIVYNLEFTSVYQALKFLEPYPVGPAYRAILDCQTGQVSLEPEEGHGTNFVFGPLMD
jgi:hypothetical protein